MVVSIYLCHRWFNTKAYRNPQLHTLTFLLIFHLISLHSTIGVSSEWEKSEGGLEYLDRSSLQIQQSLNKRQDRFKWEENFH